MKEDDQNKGPGLGSNDGPGGGKDDHEQVEIIVNARKKKWDKEKISYEDLVAIAGLPLPDGPDAGFTITYRGGPSSKPDGTLLPGQSVKVKDKMVFNVTPTNRS